MLFSFLLDLADLASQSLQVILKVRICLLDLCLVCHDKAMKTKIQHPSYPDLREVVLLPLPLRWT